MKYDRDDRDPLVLRFLQGSLSIEDASRLSDEIRRDPGFRVRLAHLAFIESSLGEALEHGDPVCTRRRRPWTRRGAIAAALLIGAGLAGWAVMFQRAAPQFDVRSGQVLVDGRPSTEIRSGSVVHVVGTGSAQIGFADGSTAELAPSSTAVLHGKAGEARPRVQLLGGGGRFRVRQGPPGEFTLVTPIANVSVLGTEFIAELLQADSVAAPAEEHLLVSVVSGRVRVEQGAEIVELLAGEGRIFPRRGRVGLGGPMPNETVEWTGELRGRVASEFDGAGIWFHILKAKGVPESESLSLVGRVIRILPAEAEVLDIADADTHLNFLKQLERKENPSGLLVRRLSDGVFTLSGLTPAQAGRAEVYRNNRSRSKRGN
jgi:ferric-dicitrate binding protein FerR (iron transport regulator)